MKNLSPERARGIRRRMTILSAGMALLLGTVVSDAFRIQVIDGDAWFELAERQRQRRLHITPKRGTIYDRNGAPLAESVEVPSISADTVEMLRGIDDQYVPGRIQAYGERIAQALNLEPADVIEKLSRRRRFVWLKRRVSEAEVEAVRALGDKGQRYPVRGLTIEGEGHRFYPNRELAGPLIGFVSPDGDGKEGLELSLEHELRGSTAEVKGLRDRSGRLIFAEGIDDEQALAGHNVYLTIDKAIQFTAERELDAAMKTYEAIGGSVIVLDPTSGEILAMASAPGFNPNDYHQSDPEARRNRGTTDRFEPGSTMKAFTVAAALAHKTITPTTSLYCEEGNMAIDNVVIHDTHVHKWLTPTQVLAQSSNIGAAKIALGLSEPRLYEAFRRFGFGDAPGLPVPGESVGVLRPRGRPWVQVETASASFGQGISVTAVQLATAMAALANGGKLLEPTLVKRVADGTGSTLTESTTRVRRDVIPASTARIVSEMLVAVTEGDGTGVEAAIPGYRVAGKTATAQKIDPATGKYTDTHYVASFVGFVPAEKPRLVISVTLDEPMGGTHAGGSVAAPVFRRVGEMALRYLGVMPKGSAPMKLSDVAAMAKDGDPAEGAYTALGVNGAAAANAMPSKALAEGETAAEGAAAAADAKTEADKTSRAEAARLAGIPPKEGEVKVPDMKGLPTREALKAALSVGLVPSIVGTGKLSRQEPPAGVNVPKGEHIKLIFEPPA